MKSVQQTLKLAEDKDENLNNEILKFITKAASIFFKTFISDPKIVLDLTVLGTHVKFNQMKYDSLDGFVKQGHDCVIILPPVFKEQIGGDMLHKGMILPIDYEFP